MPFAFLPKISELMDELDNYGDPAIGIVWDAANSHFAHEDLGDSLRRCRERLKLVHLSDTNRWQYRHDAVGLGTVPFAEIPPALEEVGYARRTVLEVISHEADRDILSSVQSLTEKGFAEAAGKPKRTRAAKR
jgi:sugar phosphate isomerase/epimerase